MGNAMLNMPKHTKCTNCGECCGIIPATHNEIEAIRKYIAENNIVPADNGDKTKCPFRDEQQKKCLIYQVRPVICRLLGVAEQLECLNGNSANIDGQKFISANDVRTAEIINFIDWRKEVKK